MMSRGVQIRRKARWGAGVLALLAVAVTARAQTPAFAAPAAYNMQPGTMPVSAITGVFNGSGGLLDFAVLERNSDTGNFEIEIFHGRVDGSFCTNCKGLSIDPDLISFGNGVYVNAMAAGQFRSGTVDIALATNSGISFLHNDGAGNFSLSSTAISSANGFVSLAVGLFNGDANYDIAASASNVASFTVFFGDGTGAFPQQSAPYVVGGSSSNCPTILQIGFQGQTTQNDLALMCSNSTAATGLVYLNAVDGSGNFTAGPKPYTGSSFLGVPAMAVGEINGEAGMFFSTQTGTFQSYESNGLAGSANLITNVLMIPVGLAPDGTTGPLLVLYGQPTNAIDFVSDISGVSIDSFTSYTQNGPDLNGTWTLTEGLGPAGVEAVGYSPNISAGPTYVVIDASDHIGTYPNFYPYVDQRSIGVSLVALNADGTVASTNAAPVYAGTGAHGYNFPPSFATGDFNGDGKLDLAVTGADDATGDAALTIYLASANGSIPSTTSLPIVGISNTDYAAADAIVAGKFRPPQSGKQLSDLAVFGLNKIFVLPSNGDGTFGTGTSYALGSDPNYPGYFYNPSAGSVFAPVLLAVDVNGDGVDDLVLTVPEANCGSSGVSQGAVYVLISKGDGTFQDPVFVPPPVVNPVSITAAKFFGGAVPDLVLGDGGEVCTGNTASTALTAVGILQNKVVANATTVTAGDFIATPILAQGSDLTVPDVSSVASADFGNGKPDVVVSSAEGIEVLLNQGAGSFAPTTQGVLPLYAGDVVPGPLCNAMGNYVGCVTYDAQVTTGSFFVASENDVAAAVDGIAYVFKNSGGGILVPPTQGFVAGLSSTMVSAALTGSNGLSALLVALPQGAAYLANATATGGSATVFSPSSLAFGSFTIGTTSAVQNVDLTNDGTSSLTVSAVSVGGANGGDFTKVADNCSGATVAAGASCTVGVTFEPSGVGSRSASLSFADNAPATPQAVALTGTGACQTITVGPTTLASGTSGTLYPSVTFTETGGIGTTSLMKSGALPTGMVFNSPTLSGTPTATGSFPFQVTATDSNGCTGSVNETLVISSSSNQPAIVNDAETITVTDTESFPDIADAESIAIMDTDTVRVFSAIAITPSAATFNASNSTAYATEPYAAVQFTATGGTGALVFTESGALPAGMTFANGTLSGTPAESTLGNTYTFSVTAADADGDTLTLQGYTVTVDEHPPVLLISASPASLSIAQGQSGQTTLTFSPSGGYTATLSLNCLSLPANARCVFSQGGTSISSVTLNGNNLPATVDLTLQTDVPEVVARTRGGGSGATWLAMVLWWPGCFLGLAALCHGRRLRRSLSQRYLAALLLVVSGAIAAGLTGCAHEAARSLTPLGTSTIEVVATPSSGSAQTLTITVTITK